MHRFIKLTACILTCILLLGCQPYVYYGNYTSLYSVCVCAVPGAGSEDAFIGKLEVLDTDSYGRTLFCHKQLIPFYSSSSTWAYVVCQQYDDRGGYYYRDICFELTGSENSLSTERLTALKARNRWELPLDLDDQEMCYTPSFTAFRFSNWEADNGYYFECAHSRDMSALLSEFDPVVFGGSSLYVHCFDIYDDGRALYIVKVDGKKACFVATYSDGSVYEGSPIWIEAPYAEGYYKQLTSFRAAFEAASAEQENPPGSP